MRIGLGLDVHRLVDGRDLYIGGVKIDYNKGLLGHSDADVLIHAIMDAILGALNKRDIGYHFPDTDNEYKDIDSKVLLKKVYEMMYEEGYEVGNIDSVVACEKPKLKDYIDDMQKTIAKILNTDEYNISVKATTTEKLGYVGEGKGIKATSICLLKRRDV